jgi:DNA-binding transcriptional MerR regulator
LRSSSGYRLYSEDDLLKLQQIISLKSLGFELSKIKKLFSKENGKDVRERFRMQHQLIQEKLVHLQQAHKALVEIMRVCDSKELVDLKTILKLMEVYRITQKFKKSWVGEIFTNEQLKKFADMDPDNIPREVMEQYGKDYKPLLKAVKRHLAEGPSAVKSFKGNGKGSYENAKEAERDV